MPCLFAKLKEEGADEKGRRRSSRQKKRYVLSFEKVFIAEFLQEKNVSRGERERVSDAYLSTNSTKSIGMEDSCRAARCAILLIAIAVRMFPFQRTRFPTGIQRSWSISRVEEILVRFIEFQTEIQDIARRVIGLLLFVALDEHVFDVLLEMMLLVRTR